jgi:hypothetical protein
MPVSKIFSSRFSVYLGQKSRGLIVYPLLYRFWLFSYRFMKKMPTYTEFSTLTPPPCPEKKQRKFKNLE